MQIETQRYRGTTRTGTLSAETAVECRFGGEVETVLSACAELMPVRAEAEEGGFAIYAFTTETADKGDGIS